MLKTLFSNEFWIWPEVDYSKASKPEERFFGPFAWGLGIALCIGIGLALSTYGTNDVLFFKSYAVKAARTGVASLYRDGAQVVEFHTDDVEPMATPPGMIHVLEGLLWMEGKTGCSVPCVVPASSRH